MASASETTCYLSLGSNLGARAENLLTALRRLGSLAGVRIERLSSLYDTTPVGVTEQPRFLNMVAELRVQLPARELLAACQRIERELGRDRQQRWGPRTLDLDLLLYGKARSDDPQLVLPHPRMTERQFVLVPLTEIAPDLVLPDGRTVAEAADPRDPNGRLTGQVCLE